MAGLDEESSPIEGARPSILDGLVPQLASNVLNVNDVSDSSHYLKPHEVDAYNEYQEANPATGALSMNDYYPGFTPGGAVGTSSGSLIGTQSLFGGGGALVPIGMMDARDLAVQKAALGKAKEVDDFRKQFRKAPTSKLTNLNENLTKEYYSFHNDSWQKALKQAKGNPSIAKRILENDPDYWAKDKSFQDSAKMGDEIATKTAQDELDIRTGKFVPTPEYNSLKDKLYRAQDPNNPDFKNLRNIYSTMNLERDFSNSFDQVTKRMVADEMGTAWNEGLNDDADFIKTWHKKVKEWSPEQKEGITNTLIESFYPESTYYTPEKIKRNVEWRTRGSSVDKKVSVQQKRDDKSEDNYDDQSVVAESGEKVVSGGQAKNSYTEKFVPTNAKDQAKKLKFAVSKDMVSADGSPVKGGETGYVTGSVQGIGVKPYYTRENRYLTDDEVAAVKGRGDLETTDDIEYRPVVIFNLDTPKIETTDEEGNVISTPGEQKTVYFDTQKLAGVFKGKNKGKDYETMREKIESYAKDKNKNRVKNNPDHSKKAEPKKAEVKSDTPKKETGKKAEDLRKKYKY